MSVYSRHLHHLFCETQLGDFFFFMWGMRWNNYLPHLHCLYLNRWIVAIININLITLIACVRSFYSCVPSRIRLVRAAPLFLSFVKADGEWLAPRSWNISCFAGRGHLRRPPINGTLHGVQRQKTSRSRGEAEKNLACNTSFQSSRGLFLKASVMCLALRHMVSLFRHLFICFWQFWQWGIGVKCTPLHTYGGKNLVHQLNACRTVYTFCFISAHSCAVKAYKMWSLLCSKNIDRRSWPLTY